MREKEGAEIYEGLIDGFWEGHAAHLRGCVLMAFSGGWGIGNWIL